MRTLSPAKVEQAKTLADQMTKEGRMSVLQIKKKTGISYGALRRLLKKTGHLHPRDQAQVQRPALMPHPSLPASVQISDNDIIGAMNIVKRYVANDPVRRKAVAELMGI